MRRDVTARTIIADVLKSWLCHCCSIQFAVIFETVRYDAFIRLRIQFIHSFLYLFIYRTRNSVIYLVCFLSFFLSFFIIITVQSVILVPSPMSLAGVHPLDMHGSNSSELINRSQSFGALSSLSRSYGSLSSLEDVHQFLSQSEQAVLSIEELRLQLNSCFTCGVSWQEEHVSLDCSECGGYSLERPCPLCDGRCDNTWKRDLTMTHASGKARWEGECGLERSLAQTRLLLQPLSLSPDTEAQLCQRLDNLKS